MIDSYRYRRPPSCRYGLLLVDSVSKDSLHLEGSGVELNPFTRLQISTMGDCILFRGVTIFPGIFHLDLF